jgi:TonB family protein
MRVERFGNSIRKMRVASVLLLLGSLATAGRADQRAVKQKVAPIYPEIAKRLRVTGVVKLAVSVNADGKVTDIKTVSGNHMLSAAAEDAVYKWKFVPASSESTEDLDINFELNQ